MIHISFLFMIAGGICTACVSRHGSLHLYPLETASTFVLDDGHVAPLPAPVTLASFDIERYPDSKMPKDYRSTLITAGGDTLGISMNHIGRLAGGFRLYQNSYDEYGGSFLTVTQDPVGTTIVYFGFLLFAFGAILHITSRIGNPKTRCATLYSLSVAILSLGICLVCMNPHKEGQLPVLATWWLPLHVGFAAAGYIVLASTFPLAILSILCRRLTHRMLSMARALLAPGLFLLGYGIIIGAMWANVSWGRYWGWDPKETWALITFLVYSIPLHLHNNGRTMVRPYTRIRLFITFLILGALAIAMTYWGTSYLPSLHSYI